MTDPEHTGKVQAPKQPYEKPAIAWEEELSERPNLMAACAQRPAEGVDCIAEPFS